jgi:hypothetical protein
MFSMKIPGTRYLNTHRIHRTHGRSERKGPGGGLGLLPNAKSRPPRCYTGNRERPKAIFRRSTSPLYAPNKLSGGLARVPVARPISFLFHGRAASVGRGTLCRIESGTCWLSDHTPQQAAHWETIFFWMYWKPAWVACYASVDQGPRGYPSTIGFCVPGIASTSSAWMA